MKINYFQQGGSTPYRTASPDKAYEDPLDIIKLRLNQAGFEGTKAILPGTTKPQEQLSPVSTYRNPLFKSALNEAWWLKQANDATSGLFKTIDDIIAWQKANGLVADGKFGKNSIAKWNALNPKPVPAASAEDKSLDLMIQAGEKLAANKLLRLTSNLFSGIQSGITTENQYPAMLQTENRNNTIRLNADIINRRQNPLQFYAAFKQGGQINYLQAGGQMQDPIAEVISGLIQNPQQTIQVLSQSKDANAIVQEIVKRAKAGDQQAAQAVLVLQQIMQLQQTPVAKSGAKLNYFRKLRGKCPEGEEMIYMKNGGCMCQKKKDGGETKIDKKQFFGKDKKVSKAAAGIRLNVYPDSVTVHDRRDINGNGTYTETFPNDSVSTTVYGKDIQGFSAPYGNPTITKNKAGKVLVRAGSNLPLSEGRLLHGTDSTFISNKANDINNSKSLQTDTIFKLPIVFTHKNGGALDKSENKKFFKKQKKAPLAKCGGKSKMKKK